MLVVLGRYRNRRKQVITSRDLAFQLQHSSKKSTTKTALKNLPLGFWLVNCIGPTQVEIGLFTQKGVQWILLAFVSSPPIPVDSTYSENKFLFQPCHSTSLMILFSPHFHPQACKVGTKQVEASISVMKSSFNRIFCHLSELCAKFLVNQARVKSWKSEKSSPLILVPIKWRTILKWMKLSELSWILSSATWKKEEKPLTKWRRRLIKWKLKKRSWLSWWRKWKLESMKCDGNDHFQLLARAVP